MLRLVNNKSGRSSLIGGLLSFVISIIVVVFLLNWLGITMDDVHNFIVSIINEGRFLLETFKGAAAH